MQTAISHPYTTILYESPHQLRKTLEELAALCPERPMAICKELTKIYETVFRGTAAQLLQQSEGWEIRGEYILVLGGAPVERQEVEDKADSEAARLYGPGNAQQGSCRWWRSSWGGKNRVYQLLLDQQERSK